MPRFKAEQVGPFPVIQHGVTEPSSVSSPDSVLQSDMWKRDPLVTGEERLMDSSSLGLMHVKPTEPVNVINSEQLPT